LIAFKSVTHNDPSIDPENIRPHVSESPKFKKNLILYNHHAI